MIFHENRLLADDSHVISYLIFVKKSQNLSSAAVVIGAIRVKYCLGFELLRVLIAFKCLLWKDTYSSVALVHTGQLQLREHPLSQLLSQI